MTTATMSERDELLLLIAQHIVEGRYTYNGLDDLALLVANKMGHNVTDQKELRVIEKHIKEIRAGK